MLYFNSPMTLYLKYRPQNFADVVGQDHIVTTLEQAISQDRTSHAYLFCGTRGTGKTSVARILAKTILLQGVTDETLKKHIIKGIEDGSLVDLTEIDAASNRRIDDIRDLIEKIGFSPAVSKAKIYIIDEVHMLTKEAFNALLKTLEEPPEYAYFILATTELHKVPDTIQSRCQRFLFKKVKDDDIVRRLQYIVDQEHITVDREALRAVARHAGGSFRDGISLLDQLRSLPKITLKDVTERIGKTSGVFLENILTALNEKDTERITALVQEMEEANIPLDTVATDILTHVREDMHKALKEGKSPTPFIAMTDVLLRALKDLRLSPVPGLALESALLLMCTGQTSTPVLSHEPVKATPKPAHPEPIIEKKAAPTPVTNTEETTKAAPEKEATQTKPSLIEAEELTTQNVLRRWEELLKLVTPPSVRMSLKDASVGIMDDGTLRLTFASAFHRDKIADTKASRTVEDALLSIFKKPIRIQCVQEKMAPRETSSGPTTDLVEAAAEVFGGM